MIDRYERSVGMNHHQLIRNLVIDGHMNFQEVLDMTPYQIAAMLVEESSNPGEIDIETWRKIQNGG